MAREHADAGRSKNRSHTQLEVIMWFASVFGSSRRRERRKHTSRLRPRHLALEPLELRRLLTVTISGNIDVSNLTCAEAGVARLRNALPGARVDWRPRGKPAIESDVF
jgi:hypothetical protein